MSHKTQNKSQKTFNKNNRLQNLLTIRGIYQLKYSLIGYICMLINTFKT